MKPSVLFVCVKNGGKSQMAAGLMSALVDNRITVFSAGTQPGTKINDLSAQVLLAQGIDIRTERPKLLTEDAMKVVDLSLIHI